DDVDRRGRHGDDAEDRRDDVVVRAGRHERADEGDARDRVRGRHERRVEERRHPRDDLVAEEGRPDEDVEAGAESFVHRGAPEAAGVSRSAATRGWTGLPAWTAHAPATTSSARLTANAPPSPWRSFRNAATLRA